LSDLETDLRYLGVLDKAIQITEELGPQAAVSYVRSAYRLLSKVYHPDLHQKNRQAAEEGQRRLNAVKERLDQLEDQALSRFFRARLGPVNNHPRVLVVEDEPGLKSNLADLLGLEGYNVATASHGVAGLKTHLTFRPDLVISDVVMPIMDGVEMVRNMRVRDPDLKVLFISGFFGTRSIREELMDEIKRFGYPMLSKPFRPSRLFEIIRQVMAA
jgi:CheY-like chemotaxis protein